jgi:hypothetical protein
MQLFLDCDGVLADFDTFFEERFGMNAREYERVHGGAKFWFEIESFPGGFFRQLPKMKDADELVDAVRHLHPIILTGAPKGSTWPQPQKEAWRDEHFPDLPMICCQSKVKYTHMASGKHNVIIDDWHKWKSIWENNGGTFILHTSAKDSIAQLKALGIL